MVDSLYHDALEQQGSNGPVIRTQTYRVLTIPLF
jgi:hypothetical protein